MAANISGYMYHPGYMYADLRTEPACRHPVYPEYTKKQMREERRKRGVQEEDAAGAFAVPSIAVKDFAAVAQDDDLAAAQEVHQAGAFLMPNIQRLSLIGDPDSDDDEDEDEDGTSDAIPSRIAHHRLSLGLAFPEEMLRPLGSKSLEHKASVLTKVSSKSDVTVVPRIKNKSPDATSVMTTIHHGAPQRPKAISDLVAAETTANSSQSPGPVKFIRPPHPFNYEGSSSSGSPLLPRPAEALSETDKADMDYLAFSSDSTEFIHPWPDLWPGYQHKRAKLSDRDWKIVNALLCPLGMNKYGKIEPCDPQNFEAYTNISKLLKVCWLVMTGQISPNECPQAYQLLKPLLEKEPQEKEAKLKVLEQKLKLRREALKISEPKSKKPSGSDYSRSTSLSSTPAMHSFSQMSSPPPPSTTSPFPSFNDYFTDSPVSPSDVASKRSSAQSTDNHPGSQTPSKARRMASFTNMFGKSPKTPKSPKKGLKSHSRTGSAGDDDKIITTPLDAPPVPVIPASFSNRNTPATSFDSAPATAQNTSLPVSSPTVMKKVSMSFGASPSSNSFSNIIPNRQPSSSFTSSTSGSSSKRNTPVTSDGTPMRIQVPSNRTTSGSFSSVPPSGRQTPLMASDSNPFCPRVGTPATMMMHPNSSFASTIADSSAPEKHHSSKHSRTSSSAGGTSNNPDYNVFDAHLEELIREFRAWDTDGPGTISDEDEHQSPTKTAILATVHAALQPLDKENLDKLKGRDRAALVAAATALSKPDLHLAATHAARVSKYPLPAPNAAPRHFGALPALALRIATLVLDAANAAFLPKLDCAYELANAAHAARERAWRARNPHDPVYPGPGVSRPPSREYLRAGYACAWATRFVVWAQEAAQVWEWENVDVPTKEESGGGLRRQGRTREVRNLLGMVDEEVRVDRETGEVVVEGEGAVLSVEEVERRFEALVEREEERGMGEKWEACEEQIRRLRGLLAPGMDE